MVQFTQNQWLLMQTFESDGYWTVLPLTHCSANSQNSHTNSLKCFTRAVTNVWYTSTSCTSRFHFPVWVYLHRHHSTRVRYPEPGTTDSRAGCETGWAVGCPVVRCHASSSMSSQRQAAVTSHPRRPAFVQHRKIVQARRFFDHIVHLTRMHVINTTAANCLRDTQRMVSDGECTISARKLTILIYHY